MPGAGWRTLTVQGCAGLAQEGKTSLGWDFAPALDDAG